MNHRFQRILTFMLVMELFTVKFLNKAVFYVCYFAFEDFSFNSMQKYCINCSYTQSHIFRGTEVRGQLADKQLFP